MSTITQYWITDAGLQYLADELNRLHKQFARTPIDPTLPTGRSMLHAWAAQAEQRMDDGESPEVEIGSADAVSGHTELIYIESSHFTQSEEV